MKTTLFSRNKLLNILFLGALTGPASADIVNFHTEGASLTTNQANFYLLGMANNSILVNENSVITIPVGELSNTHQSMDVISDNNAVSAVYDDQTIIVYVNDVEEDVSVNLRVVNSRILNDSEFTITLNVVNETFAIDTFATQQFVSNDIGETIVGDTQEWLAGAFSHISMGKIGGSAYTTPTTSSAGLNKGYNGATQLLARSGFGEQSSNGSGYSFQNSTYSKQSVNPVAALNLSSEPALSPNRIAYINQGQQRAKEMAFNAAKQLVALPIVQRQLIDNPPADPLIEPNNGDSGGIDANPVFPDSPQGNNDPGIENSPEQPPVVQQILPTPVLQPYNAPLGEEEPILQAVKIPEPSTFILLLIALTSIVFVTRNPIKSKSI